MSAEVGVEAGHRRWLSELGLAHFEPSSPGMAFWLPAGMTVMRALRDLFWQEHSRAGYEEVSTPQLAEVSVFETSGHVPHFEDSMFFCQLPGDRRFGVKPASCPGSMLLFRSRRHSYRDLPVRWYCEDVLHRKELSGTLSGLLRVQEFRQDDSHIFVPERLIGEELSRVLALARRLYRMFGLSFRLRLGTAPALRLGDDATWNRAIGALRAVLDDEVGRDAYQVVEGEGSFYAPKLDVLVDDAQGREWQTGTLQVDYQQPARFGCSYVERDGSKQTPVVIHRAIAGTFERLLGVLLEQGDGRLPLVLAPVQVEVVPVATRHAGRAAEVGEALRQRGFRAHAGDGSDRVAAAIRRAAERRVPCVAVIGDRELAEGSVSVRLRDENGSSRSMGPDSLASLLAASLRVEAA